MWLGAEAGAEAAGGTGRGADGTALCSVLQAVAHHTRSAFVWKVASMASIKLGNSIGGEHPTPKRGRQFVPDDPFTVELD